jgi:hypothetical protein
MAVCASWRIIASYMRVFCGVKATARPLASRPMRARPLAWGSPAILMTIGRVM